MHSASDIQTLLSLALRHPEADLVRIVVVAARLAGKSNRSVAIIGDGAMTGGMAFEALNNAGALGEGDLVKVGDAGDVDEGCKALADATLQFKDQVGAACHDAGLFTVSLQGLQGSFHAGCIEISMPHRFSKRP